MTEAIFRQVAGASEAADADGGRAGTDPTPIIFTHVSVIPMDGDRILPDQDVTIRSKLIASVEPAASARLPKDAQIIEGTGKFLMPGQARCTHIYRALLIHHNI